MENKRILEVVEIAKKLGFEVDFDTDIETKDVFIYFTIYTFTFYIGVSSNADAREISDQLYMFVESFDDNIVPELYEEREYTQSEINEIRKKVYELFKEHLALREKRIGIGD